MSFSYFRSTSYWESCSKSVGLGRWLGFEFVCTINSFDGGDEVDGGYVSGGDNGRFTVFMIAHVSSVLF